MQVRSTESGTSLTTDLSSVDIHRLDSATLHDLRQRLHHPNNSSIDLVNDSVFRVRKLLGTYIDFCGKDPLSLETQCAFFTSLEQHRTWYANPGEPESGSPEGIAGALKDGRNFSEEFFSFSYQYYPFDNETSGEYIGTLGSNALGRLCRDSGALPGLQGMENDFVQQRALLQHEIMSTPEYAKTIASVPTDQGIKEFHAQLRREYRNGELLRIERVIALCEKAITLGCYVRSLVVELTQQVGPADKS